MVKYDWIVAPQETRSSGRPRGSNKNGAITPRSTRSCTVKMSNTIQEEEEHQKLVIRSNSDRIIYLFKSRLNVQHMYHRGVFSVTLRLKRRQIAVLE